MCLGQLQLYGVGGAGPSKLHFYVELEILSRQIQSLKFYETRNWMAVIKNNISKTLKLSLTLMNCGVPNLFNDLLLKNTKKNRKS